MISGETRPRLESFILLIYPTFSATKRTKVYFFIISLTPINYFCGLEKLDLELLQAHCRELKENLQKTQQKNVISTLITGLVSSQEQALCM